jgi:hypothetical protein
MRHPSSLSVEEAEGEQRRGYGSRRIPSRWGFSSGSSWGGVRRLDRAAAVVLVVVLVLGMALFLGGLMSGPSGCVVVWLCILKQMSRLRGVELGGAAIALLAPENLRWNLESIFYRPLQIELLSCSCLSKPM